MLSNLKNVFKVHEPTGKVDKRGLREQFNGLQQPH